MKRVYREVINGKEHRFPPLDSWIPEQRKSEKSLKELEKWHAQETARYEADPSLEYNVEAELEEYCRF